MLIFIIYIYDNLNNLLCKKNMLTNLVTSQPTLKLKF